MPISLLFWIVYIIAILVYGVFNWPLNRTTGAGLIVFVLIGLLGWRVSGPILQ